MRIRVTSPAFSPTGFGELSRSIIWALHHAGHELSVNMQNFSASVESPERFGEKGLLAAELHQARLWKSVV